MNGSTPGSVLTRGGARLAPLRALLAWRSLRSLAATLAILVVLLLAFGAYGARRVLPNLPVAPGGQANTTGCAAGAPCAPDGALAGSNNSPTAVTLESFTTRASADAAADDEGLTGRLLGLVLIALGGLLGWRAWRAR